MCVLILVSDFILVVDYSVTLTQKYGLDVFFLLYSESLWKFSFYLLGTK